jgi:ribosomal protein L17
VTFKPGQSGNPAGHKPGLTHRITAELRQVVAKDAKEIVQSIIASAKAGDVESRRAFLRYLLPQSKWPTPFALPPITGPADVPQAVQAVLDAAAKGELSLEDAERIVGLLAGLRAAYEGASMLDRLAELEARLAALTAQSGGHSQ